MHVLHLVLRRETPLYSQEFPDQFGLTLSPANNKGEQKVRIPIFYLSISLMLLNACTRDPKPQADPTKTNPLEETTPPSPESPALVNSNILNEIKLQLETSINQQLESAFQEPISIDQKAEKALNIIQGVETQVTKTLNQAQAEDQFSKETKSSRTEISLLTYQLQQKLSEKAIHLMTQEFNMANKELLDSIDKLDQTVAGSYPLLTVNVPLQEVDKSQLPAYYNQNIELPTQQFLAKKYAPHELALVQKPQPVTLKDIPYQFKAPEEEFLQTIQALYLKIYNAHPYHEQGRIARALALLALEVADQTRVAKEEQVPHLSYQIAQALMLNINSDFFEESELLDKEKLLDLGQSIYEILSGKHFLTGRTLTDFERTTLFLSATLSLERSPQQSYERLISSLSTVLSQVHIQAQSKKPDLFIEGLDSTLLDQVITALEWEKETNMQKIQGDLDFLTQHFAGKNPTQEEISQALKAKHSQQATPY